MCIAVLYTCSNLSAWPEAVRGLPAAPKKQEFRRSEWTLRYPGTTLAK